MVRRDGWLRVENGWQDVVRRDGWLRVENGWLDVVRKDGWLRVENGWLDVVRRDGWLRVDNGWLNVVRRDALQLSGTVSQDFLLQVFFKNYLPPSPQNNVRFILNFSENSRRYSQVKVHHRYQRHRRG